VATLATAEPVPNSVGSEEMGCRAAMAAAASEYLEVQIETIPNTSRANKKKSEKQVKKKVHAVEKCDNTHGEDLRRSQHRCSEG
jgi:hypothetical protein